MHVEEYGRADKNQNSSCAACPLSIECTLFLFEVAVLYVTRRSFGLSVDIVFFPTTRILRFLVLIPTPPNTLNIPLSMGRETKHTHARCSRPLKGHLKFSVSQSLIRDTYFGSRRSFVRRPCYVF